MFGSDCIHWSNDGAGGYRCVETVAVSSCPTDAIHSEFQAGLLFGAQVVGVIVPAVLVIWAIRRMMFP